MEKGQGRGTGTSIPDEVFTRKEYIEREAALEIAMQYCPDDDGSCSKAGADLREMLDELEAIPAADVAPVRHGKWHGEYDGYADGEPVYDMWFCSACGWGCDGQDEEPTWKYCPNCGARMDIKDGGKNG